MRAKLAVLALLIVSAASRAASAGAGGILKDASLAGTFYVRSILQNPGETLTLSTSNLSAGGDTVMHVQDFSPQGGFVAGNDDEPGGVLTSRVTIPPVGSVRFLNMIIRAYNDNTPGTCNVTVTSSLNGTSVFPNVTFGGRSYRFAQGFANVLGTGSHVSTVERQGTGSDTLMLVIDSTAHALGFNDNDGIGNMSMVRLGTSCSSCAVVVAHASATAGPGKTNIIWDEDAETNDADGDGLGLGLETALHTNPNDRDSDHDGLDDALEVYGRESGTVLKLPAWGADPTLQDIFVEADWLKCTDASCTSPDWYKIGGAPGWSPPADVTLAQVKQSYLPMRVHLDVAIVNPDPATQEDWGDWGGAERHDTSGDACDGFTESRKGIFRHLMVNYPLEYTGIGAPCAYVTPFPGNIFHEMGHGFGLQHGGLPESIALNYKMNYPSTMNYGYDVLHFAHGVLPTLNPTRLDETLGIGTTDPEVVNNIQSVFCAGQAAGRCISGQKVDWNRDGVISPSTSLVRGMISINYTAYLRSKFYGKLNDAAMTWVSPSGSGGVGDWLWIFGRGPSNQLQYTTKARVTIEQGCGGVSPLVQLTDGMQDCAGFFDFASDYPGNKIISFAPGVAELGGGAFVIVTQPMAGGSLVSNIIHLDSTGQVTFGADVALPGAGATGDVTALATGPGAVSAWAPVNNRLMEWTYASGAWSGPTAQQWVSNPRAPLFISPLYGIGATRGFVSSSSSAQTFAAIPTTPNGAVEFARKTSNGQWTKLTSSWSDIGGVQPTVQARPGLAYMRMDPAQPATTGRFYLAVNMTDPCESPGPTHVFGSTSAGLGCESRLVFTEGNLDTGAPASRRLVWVTPGSKFGATADELGSLHALRGVALLGDLTRSKNLMAIKTYPSTPPGAVFGNTEFSPLADGIINANIADIDEYAYIETNLAARVATRP
jgi:hypothetical protein